ncbi:MAG: N-acetyltransferase [Schleiferiaceae bacterium]|jgi:UDP-2-acetamido-3-amino-2,3-dideoxy-glucuronate N-acetyltransferase|nr:N-acetyltransferase [Schleiferiaceae bacterium]MDP4876686.1 N-acetyltransferase [Schleiferiaceae bacterium]MDP4959830.1 N-acetyltransferase [Schleiferiaceae bacterium]
MGDYFVHETAVVDANVQIGPGSKVWHFSHIMPHCSLGANCILGQNVFLGDSVTIGSGVKIQNNVSVYSGVEIEDDVFLGPSMVFTNVNAPRSFIEQKNYARTVVKKGASIGANATIVCGNTIGAYAFIGAGAVVTHEVPDFAFMYGVPAKQQGWVSRAGARLNFDDGTTALCETTGEKYELRDGVVAVISQ